jgi:putative membrane protein
MHRRLMTTVAIVAALASVSACKKAGDGAKSAGDKATDAVSTSNGVVAGAEDKTAQAVGQTSAATVGAMTDGGFVVSAAQSDMYEVQAAKIAEERSKNPAIKKFAAEMIKAHTGTTNELKKALPISGVNVSPPADLDDRRKGMLNNLSLAKAENFDKTYIDQQVAAHDEAETLFKGYADHGGNATLKPWAAATAPKVQGHLDMARQIQSTIK